MTKRQDVAARRMRAGRRSSQRQHHEQSHEHHSYVEGSSLVSEPCENVIIPLARLPPSLSLTRPRLRSGGRASDLTHGETMPRHPASHQAGKTAPKRRKDCHSAPACVLSSCSSRRGLDGSLFEPPAAGLHGGSFQRRVREGSPSLSTPHRCTGGVPAAAASSPSRAPSVSFSVSCASAYEERRSGLDQRGEASPSPPAARSPPPSPRCPSAPP